MKVVLILFFAIAAVASTFDSATCVFTNNNGEKFNYEALSKIDLSYTSDAIYHLRLCNPAPSCSSISETASVCQKTTSGAMYSLGEYPTQAVNELSDNPSVGTLFIYSGGARCNNGPERRTNVIVRCSADVDGRISSVYEDNCEYFFYVDTKYACANTSPNNNENSKKSGGLSAGSVLLIIFFSCASVYLVAGMVYNYKINNKTGVDMVPNVEFWMDLPSLCKEGFFFLINGCKKSPATSGYDTV